MGLLLKLYQIVRTIGSKVWSWGITKVRQMIAWVWAHKGTIATWLGNGWTIAGIVAEIYRRLFG